MAAKKKRPGFLDKAFKEQAPAVKKAFEKAIKKAPVPRENTTPPIQRVGGGLFAPGISANPGGRPKKTPVEDAISEALSEKVPGDKMGRTYAQICAKAAVIEAAKGSIEALKEITDRTEGRSRQRVEHTGRCGGAIDVSNLTPEQRDEELAILAAKLGYVRVN